MTRIRALLALGAVAICITAVATFAVFWVGRSPVAWSKEIAALRAAGEPVSGDDLERFYRRPPDKQDATGLWLAAIEPFLSEELQAQRKGVPIVDYEHQPIPMPGEPWPDRERAEQLLETYKPELLRLHEAARHGGSARFPTNFSDGYLTELPHLTALRRAAHLLALESLVRAHREDPRGAAESVICIFQLAESLREEPVMISQMVRKSCNDIGGDQLLRLLASVELADEDLIRLQSLLRAMRYDRSLRRALIGERVMGAIGFERQDSIGDHVRPGPAWKFVRHADLANYLGFLQTAIEAANSPFPAALDQAEAIDEGLFKHLDTLNAFEKYAFVLTVQLTPALKSNFERVARVHACNDATAAAIALELFRRERGRLPERLEELVPNYLPEVPVDPFNGERLQFIVREDYYSIFTVGPNGVDDSQRRGETGYDDLGACFMPRIAR